MPRSGRQRRNAREEAARQEWLKRAAQWDGIAHVFNPFERRYELAEGYKGGNCEPMMAWFDRLPPWERQRIANSRDGE
jgi:hypothetical protein